MAGGKKYADEVQVGTTLTTTTLQVGGITEAVATFDIDTGKVLTLNSLPETVVAAPASGYYLEFVSATLWYDYAGAAFGGIAAGEDLQFRIGTVPVSATCETTGFLNQANDEIREVPAFCSADYEPAVATAMNLFLTAGDITAGGTSRLKGKVVYRIRPFTW